MKKGLPFVADLLRMAEQRETEEHARSVLTHSRSRNGSFSPYLHSFQPSPMRSPRGSVRLGAGGLSPAPGKAPAAASGNVFISVATQFRDSLTSLIT